MDANIVLARQGETISHIAHRVYGSSRGMVEPILALNPGLCTLPAMLPMGTPVRLPAQERQAAPVLPSINLWD